MGENFRPSAAGGGGGADDQGFAAMQLGVFGGGVFGWGKSYAGLSIGFGHGEGGAVEKDRADGGIDGGEDSLGFTEGVGEEHAGSAVGDVVSPPIVDVLSDGLWIAPAKDGQAEGAFGDEGVAFDEFERFACGIGLAFVVAGDEPDLAGVFDADLRGAEEMAGGVEGDADAIHVEGFSVFDRVDRCVVAHAFAKDVHAVGCGEIAR